MEKGGLAAALNTAGVRAGMWLGYGDEMRLGLLSQVRRVWGARGIRVVQLVEQRRQWHYLALVVNGVQGTLVWSWMANMKKESVATAVQAWQGAGVEAVVWDRAGSHRSRLVKQVGVRLVEQPAYSPEVNPAERVIEELRRQIEGRLYETLEAKMAAVEAALQRLGAEPERIRKLTGWGWIREAQAALLENTALP